MPYLSKLSRLLVAASTLALPFCTHAAESFSVSCNVAIDYTLSGGSLEAYRKAFVVKPGVGFVDDFSTPLREKRFSASAAREGNSIVVSIDYFNDVGVFHAIAFDTRMAIRDGGRAIETTAGSNTFSTSLGVTGNHRTAYTLTCQRQ